MTLVHILNAAWPVWHHVWWFLLGGSISSIPSINGLGISTAFGLDECYTKVVSEMSA